MILHKTDLEITQAGVGTKVSNGRVSELIRSIYKILKTCQKAKGLLLFSFNIRIFSVLASSSYSHFRKIAQHKIPDLFHHYKAYKL